MPTTDPSMDEKTDQALRLLSGFLQINDSSSRAAIIDHAEKTVRDEGGRIIGLFGSCESDIETAMKHPARF